MPYQANRHGGKAEAARKHYANVIQSRRTARKEKTKGSLDKYQGMITARRKYGDVLRKQAQFDKNRQMAIQERERKKANSVWSNIAMLGTSVGSMFGPMGAAIGGIAGAGLGMGMAAAKGGNPFDFGAQLAGLDPSMAAKAAMSVGKSMGYGGASRTTPNPGFTQDLDRRQKSFDSMTNDFQLQMGGDPAIGNLAGRGSTLSGGAFSNQAAALNQGSRTYGLGNFLEDQNPDMAELVRRSNLPGGNLGEL